MTLTNFTVLADGLDHPEGVAWSPKGHLYAGGEAGQVYRIGLDGSVEQVASTGGFVLGVAVDGDDNVYLCDAVRAEVLKVSMPGGALTVLSGGTKDVPFRTPNWVAFAPDGSLYVTDSGVWDENNGLVFKIDASGDSHVWSTQTSAFPNGCCLSADATSLFVVESTLPGVKEIPIAEDGAAGQAVEVLRLEGEVPDGVAVDSGGSLYVSCYRPDRIYRFTEEKLEVVAEDPRGTALAAPTNIAFAGPDLDQLVVANLGRWHLSIARVPVPGAPLLYPKLDQPPQLVQGDQI